MAVQSDAMGEGRPAWLERETSLEKVVKICVFAVIIIAVVYPFLSVPLNTRTMTTAPR